MGNKENQTAHESAGASSSKGDDEVGSGGLLPCPFCGGRPILHDWIDSEDKEDTLYYTLDCEKCGLSTKPFKSTNKVNDFWNKRQKF